MEVLHGNDLPASGHARRAADRSANARRVLDWGTRASDILLFPHSPLALTDVLSHPDGRLDLKPVPPASSAETGELERENVLAGNADGTAPVISLQERRRRRHPRERVNLLTRHGEEELFERCRQLIIENALVKNRGERQLFLAAGFLTRPDPLDPERRLRAPLLLYPVALVRRPDERRYELRLDGAPPIANAPLAAELSEHHAFELPPPDSEVPLADHLAQIASLASTFEPLELDFDIALGNADLPLPGAVEEPVRLPPVPAALDADLAAEIIATSTLVELHAVLHLLPDYAPSPAATRDHGGPDPLDTAAGSGEHAAAEASAGVDGGTEGPEIPAEPEGASAGVDLAALREYAARLAAEGLDDIEFRHLGELPSGLARWSTSVRAALATTSVTTLVGGESIGARHLVRLAGIIELIDKAPPVIEQYAHPDLCFRASATVMRRACHQARLIEDELTALQHWFVLDKVPAKRQLLSLIEELGGTIGVEPDIIDADYFNARRQFMEFSIEKPANLTAEHRRLLGQLAKVLRFRELFVNNTEYRAALGPGYRGLRTDWAALETMSDYAIELAEALDSETLAAAALASWVPFRRAFATELETLHRAADATRRLLRIGGARWHSRPTNELLEHTAALGERLAGWHADYGPVTGHGALTPAALLARFSGHEREDLLTEVRVRQARARIDACIAAETTTPARVAVTLEWLRASGDVALEHELDLEIIVAALRSG